MVKDEKKQKTIWNYIGWLIFVFLIFYFLFGGFDNLSGKFDEYTSCIDNCVSNIKSCAFEADNDNGYYFTCEECSNDLEECISDCEYHYRN